jgi:hypothetical protein
VRRATKAFEFPSAVVTPQTSDALEPSESIVVWVRPSQWANDAVHISRIWQRNDFDNDHGQHTNRIISPAATGHGSHYGSTDRECESVR